MAENLTTDRAAMFFGEPLELIDIGDGNPWLGTPMQDEGFSVDLVEQQDRYAVALYLCGLYLGTCDRPDPHDALREAERRARRIATRLATQTDI